MCGRVIQRSKPSELGLKIVNGLEDRDNCWSNFPPRYNGAPAQGSLDHPQESRHRRAHARSPALGSRALFLHPEAEATADQAAAETILTKSFPPQRPFFA